LIGIGGAGGWYLRGLAEFSRGADTVDDVANQPTESASMDNTKDRQALDQLFWTAQYEAAIELLRTLIFDEEVEPLGWASELFLLHTQRLERLGATHKAIDLLQEYLAVVPQDVDAYVLLADLHDRQGKTSAALEALASALTAAHPKGQKQLLRAFDRMFRTYLSQHRDNEFAPVDAALLERLAQELPHHEPLYLELARRYIQLGDLGVADAWLQEVDPHGDLALQRKRLLFYIERQLEQGSGFESRVSIQRLCRYRGIVDAVDA
jgi:FimV-like protein